MRHRQAVQYADRVAAHDRLVGPGRTCHGLFGDQRDDGVDLWIQTFDLRKVRSHDFARRHLFPGEPRGQLDGAHLTEFWPARLRRRLRGARGGTEHLRLERRVNASGDHRRAEPPATEFRRWVAGVGRFRTIGIAHTGTPLVHPCQDAKNAR